MLHHSYDYFFGASNMRYVFEWERGSVTMWVMIRNQDLYMMINEELVYIGLQKLQVFHFIPFHFLVYNALTSIIYSINSNARKLLMILLFPAKCYSFLLKSDISYLLCIHFHILLICWRLLCINSFAYGISRIASREWVYDSFPQLYSTYEKREISLKPIYLNPFGIHWDFEAIPNIIWRDIFGGRLLYLIASVDLIAHCVIQVHASRKQAGEARKPLQ